jgi:hypothetical protein
MTPLQMSLFDQQDLGEVAHPDYPGERLIACRSPLLAADRARNAKNSWLRPRTCWPPSSPACRPGR